MTEIESLIAQMKDTVSDMPDDRYYQERIRKAAQRQRMQDTIECDCERVFDKPLGEHRGDRKARPPGPDTKALLAAGAQDATVCAVIASRIAREKTATDDEALEIAAAAGRLLRFAELAR